MDESNADAVRYLAIEAFKAGDYDLAIEKFDALVAVSDHPSDYRSRTLTLQLLERYSEARDALQLILAEIPRTLLRYIIWVSSRRAARIRRYATGQWQLNY